MTESQGPRQFVWRLLPRAVRTLPADLAAVVVLLFLAHLAVLLPVVNRTPLRLVFALALVLFTPGYAFVAALFPERAHSSERHDSSRVTEADDSDDEQAQNLGGRRIDGVERLALSVTLSIAIASFISAALFLSPLGVGPLSVLLGNGVFTLLLVGVATLRRQSIPESERYHVPYRAWLSAARSGLLRPDSRLDGALTVALVGSILLAAGTVGFAVAFPPEGDSFSELYLLAPTEDGGLSAENYPTEFAVGESKPVVVGIGNQENQPTDYTVVVQLQRIRIDGNETVVRERREVERIRSPTIADNETWYHEHDITPTIAGERLRIQYLLYRGSPPETPTANNSYVENHLQINVTSTGGSG